MSRVQFHHNVSAIYWFTGSVLVQSTVNEHRCTSTPGPSLNHLDYHQQITISQTKIFRPNLLLMTSLLSFTAILTSFDQSSTTKTIDEHPLMEVANYKSDTDLVYPTENDFNHPTIRSAASALQKNDINHSYQCFNVSMSSNFAFSIYFSIDVISIQEDQLHTSVHLIWRAYVRIRYLYVPHSVTTIVTFVSLLHYLYVHF